MIVCLTTLWFGIYSSWSSSTCSYYKMESRKTSFQHTANMSNHVWDINTSNRIPLVDIKNIPSFESTVFVQESPDNDEPPICKKGRPVGSACKSLKSNDDGTSEPAQSLFDTIKETSTSNENKVWHEKMAFVKHKSLRDGKCFCCSCRHSEKECTAVLKVCDDGQVSISGSHATGCSHRNGVTVPSSLDSIAGNDCKDCMHQGVESHATDADHLHDNPADCTNFWWQCYLQS